MKWSLQSGTKRLRTLWRIRSFAADNLRRLSSASLIDKRDLELSTLITLRVAAPGCIALLACTDPSWSNSRVASLCPAYLLYAARRSVLVLVSSVPQGEIDWDSHPYFFRYSSAWCVIACSITLSADTKSVVEQIAHLNTPLFGIAHLQYTLLLSGVSKSFI
jgi:hypothetical protein